jgi:hypothetical protein
MFGCGVPGGGQVFALVFWCLLGGCATQQSDTSAPEPGSGVVEYKQITKEAIASLHTALDSLDKVSTQPNPCPPKVITAFSDEVQRLQIDSLRIRARAQAIQARGNAYFASWSESIARIKDPRVRALAERYHPELEQSFTKIKLASQQAGGDFKPFLSGLRTLRLQLQKGSSLTQDADTKELVRATRAHGDEVVWQLGVLSAELEDVTRMLTPGKSVAAN